MIILDTDHLSVLEFPESPHAARLTEAMEERADDNFSTTAISLEEQMRGWVAGRVDRAMHSYFGSNIDTHTPSHSRGD